MRTIKKIDVRVTRVRVAAGEPVYGTAVSSSTTVASLFTPLVGSEDQEVLIAILLDSKHRILAYHEVARGGLNAACATPHELFRAAVLQGAAALIAVHNHPSGDPSPSPDDTAFTTRIQRAGELLGIPILDHVIIAQGGGHFSFLDSGLLTKGISE